MLVTISFVKEIGVCEDRTLLGLNKIKTYANREWLDYTCI